MTKREESEIPVKEGSLKITDFEDLRLTFLELQEKYNMLVDSYKNYHNIHQHGNTI